MYGPFDGLRSLIARVRQALVVAQRSNRKPRKARRVHLGMECLESREVPATALADVTTQALSASVSAGVLVNQAGDKVTYSPDFSNLDSGGQTSQVYDGTQGKLTLTAVRGGGV